MYLSHLHSVGDHKLVLIDFKNKDMKVEMNTLTSGDHVTNSV